eukprot:15426481-Heterocapsa_arctica.AAC.1
MLRPPRNIKKDRMVTWQLLAHSYLFAGVMEAAASMLAYFCVFWAHGVNLSEVLGTAETQWRSNSP